MSRIAYVNGQYVPHSHAAVHVEDRGYQFADGVYEVVAVRNGHLVDLDPHFERLERSLGELDIEAPMSRAALGFILKETVRRNRVTDGIVYLQITRGVAPRDHQFPAEASAAIVITARNAIPKVAQREAGIGVVSTPDIRWKRCDIKTIALLPNVLAKQKAADAGAYEAWQVDLDGFVTEGSATNAWIVTQDSEIVTRQTDEAILSGVTRLAVMALAEREGITLIERPFSLEEAKTAKEAFLTSTTSNVMPVIEIDGSSIGNGHPGTVTRALSELYERFAKGD
ncbi:MAG: D-amino-acid transaminase [Alphaproteobacteria bacterium]|nr:D-amino-acid transaminase [Alphaproteobacteria bacterium]